MIVVQGNGLGYGPYDAVIAALQVLSPQQQQQTTTTTAAPVPAQTGWASWSTGTKVAVIGSGVAVLGVLGYLVLRK